MKLNKLIERLTEIRDKYNCGETPVSMMEEHEVKGEKIQFGSKVMDVAASVSEKDGAKNVSEIIIIGQELD